MNINDAGKNLIKGFESCRLKAYKDSAGVWTIGWGATYYRDGKKVKQGDVISQQEADELFDFHLNQFCTEVKCIVFQPLNDNQFSALVSFAYNVGSDIDADSLAEGLGDSTLLKKVNMNPNNPSIRDEFMKWVRAGGKVLKGLQRRRAAEADLYFS